MKEVSPVISPPPLPSQQEKRRESRNAAHGTVVVQWDDEEGKLHSVLTRIRDRSDAGLGVYCDEPIQTGLTVWLRDPDDDPEGQRLAAVRYSRPRYGRWKIGLIYVEKEQRRVERLPVSGTAELSWGYIAAEAFRCEVEVVNVSPLGAMLRADRPAPIDARARLHGPPLECMGYIRHCTPKEDAFMIGIQFAAEPLDKTKSVRELWGGFTTQYP